MRDPRRRSVPRINPLLAYPRERALAALEQAAGLEPDPVDDVIVAYQNPATGGPAMTTMGMALQRLRPGFHGNARRQTGSTVLHVVSGRGTTVVDGTRHDWAPGDFLAIRPWAWYEHLNDSGEDALLFQVNDAPAFEALGCYHQEERPSSHR